MNLIKAFSVLALLGATITSASAAAAPASADQTAITQVIRTYGERVAAGDVRGIVQLYTPDGVLIAPGSPTATGSAQVEAAYTAVFQAIGLALKFDVLEVDVQGDLAFARSTSQGEITVKANGAKQPDQFRELFVFRRINGRWLIARYMYNQGAPAAK